MVKGASFVNLRDAAKPLRACTAL
ncbi:MAG: hypothetical protein VYC02_10655 [SAR324 cluster bacterium]|nr:hypothetical protein [SAR324 cluster bacterium]